MKKIRLFFGIFSEISEFFFKFFLAIQSACENGHIESFKILIKDQRVDPSSEDNLCLRKACENGHTKIAKKLLLDHRVDPSAMDNYSIKYSSKNGKIN